MFDDFRDLSLFLHQAAPEVQGRSSEELSPALKQRLQHFSDGELTIEEARELSRELLANKNAVEHLATLLVALPHAS